MKINQIINERIYSIGLNPKYESKREQYRNEIAQMLVKSYAKVEGYGGFASGSQEEWRAIQKDITDSLIKVVTRHDHISAVKLYKPLYGRKSIAAGTDGTHRGKADLFKIILTDHELRRAWGEVSGKPEEMMTSIGSPVIPPSEVERMTGKKVRIEPDEQHYTRNIGGKPHRKIAMGHPKTT